MVGTSFLKTRWPTLLLLILLAFGLRLYRVDHADITGDEAWSVTVAGWKLADVVSSEAEFNPPLYHVLLHGMIRLVGHSTLAIRYLSVLSGLLAVALLGRLGWLVGGPSLGIITLLSGATSPFLVYYAQEARFYSVVLLGSVSSLTCLVVLLRWQRQGERPRARLWILYGLASLAMLFSHYYAFAMMSAQAAFILLFYAWQRSWRRLQPWLLVWLGMALVYLPWLAYSASFLDTRTYERYDQWTGAVWLDMAQRTLRAFGAGVTLPPDLSWIAWLVVGLAIGGCVSLWRQKPRHPYLALMSAIIVLGVITFAWMMNPILPFFYERYLLVGTPAFLLLVAVGLWGLFRLNQGSGAIGLLLLLVIAGLALHQQWFNPDFLKGSYGRLMADIQSQSHPGDLILLNNPLQESLAEIYLPAGIPSLILDRSQLLSIETTDSYMQEITSGHNRVWLVEYGDPNEYDPAHRAQRWLGQHGGRAYYENYINSGPLYMFVLNLVDEGNVQDVQANLNNEIWLISARIPDTVSSGGHLLLELTWRAVAPTERAYTVFTHLVDADGTLVAQTDSQPGGGANPTNSWSPDETIVDNYAILVPETLTPGIYTIRAGMYLWPELTRIPVIGAQTRVIDNMIDLGNVQVE